MKLKKFAAAFLSAVITFSSAVSFHIYADENIYLTRSQTAEFLINAAAHYRPYLKISDIIKGYSDGSTAKDNQVTYAEALVMLNRAFGEFPAPVGHNERIALQEQDFSSYPDWAKEEISDLIDTGIINAYSPDEKVTTEELKKITARVYAYLGSDLKDDFYNAVNKKELDKSTVEVGTNRTGTLTSLSYNVNAELAEIITELAANEYPAGSKEQKISDFYKLAADMDSRNKLGITPIQEYLDMINGAQNLDELIYVNNILNYELCVSPLFYFYISEDFNDSTKYSMYFECYSPLLQKEIYQDDDSNTVKQAFKDYIKNILVLGGNSEEIAEAKMQLVYGTQEMLSENSLDAENYSDIDKIYNIYSPDELDDIFSDIDLESVYESFGFEPVSEIIVSDIGEITAFAAFAKEENLNALKALMEFDLLNSTGGFLNMEFTDEIQKFNNVYYGTVGTLSYQDVNLSTVRNVMSDYLGQVYVEKYFSQSSKEEIEEITKTIINTYKTRIEKLSWMSDNTKKEAIKKLDTMDIKIGYPDYTESIFDIIDIIPPKDGGNYFDTIIEISQIIKLNNIQWQFEEVDKSYWSLTPQTVNAMYNPLSNDITFPAAILQPPVYDPNSSYEEKLGSIGSIIAHEVSHAFDNSGAQFDEKGNASDWWTESDYNKYNDLCKKLADFYNGKESIPDVEINGFLTLNENIADLGSISCLTDILSGLDNPDWKAFFQSYAKLWFSTGTRAYYINASQTDTHSPSKLRINCILQNIDKFYETYNITENDGMYVAPQDRITIW